MNLKLILKQIKQPFKVFAANSAPLLTDIEATDIAIDSRKVTKDTVFFGLIGGKQDGANFLPEVFNKGCRVAIISQKTTFNYQDFVDKNPAFTIIVGEVFAILKEVLNIFYQPLPENIYAITGTNGKTSTAEFTRQILNFLNIKSASIGTLGVKCLELDNTAFVDSGLTTPDIVSLYKNLAILKKNNINDVAIEVSSIALEQKRLGDLEIDIGAFTNFSQDHLDYHGDMKNYFASKMILFTEIISRNSLGAEGSAILNSDIAEFAEIKNICKNNQLKIIDYGCNAKILKIIKISYPQVIFSYNNQEFSFNTNISGDFQVYNILCALGNVVAKHDLTNQQISALMPNFNKLQSALGRMQEVCQYLGAKIFIDFAHTPDALENVLKLAKKITKNRVIILFGCGGDRDISKRPLMGEIACKNADLVIITDDNPRTENPTSIRQQILQNCDKNKVIEIADRKIAIDKTIAILQDGDVLIIAGKGHENYQIIGAQKFEFNETQIIKNAIKELSKST